MLKLIMNMNLIIYNIILFLITIFNIMFFLIQINIIIIKDNIFYFFNLTKLRVFCKIINSIPRVIKASITLILLFSRSFNKFHSIFFSKFICFFIVTFLSFIKTYLFPIKILILIFCFYDIIYYLIKNFKINN